MHYPDVFLFCTQCDPAIAVARCLLIHTLPLDDEECKQSSMVDAVWRRMARRGGRVPPWYPSVRILECSYGVFG